MKILIVDAYLVDFCRKTNGVERYKGNRKEDGFMDKLLVETLKQYLKQTTNPEYFDLTTRFHAAGGDASMELLVLGYPTCIMSCNQFYAMKNSDYQDVAKMVFDISKALEAIRKINPDVLLVDPGFWAPVPDDAAEEFILKRRQKEAAHFAIKPSCRTSALNFPVSLSAAFENSLVIGSTYSLGARAGVLLARELKKLGRPYSFWTDDLCYGGVALEFAYTLDLVSEQDIREAIASHNLVFNLNQKENSLARRSGNEREWKLRLASSRSGNILVDGKWRFTEWLVDGREPKKITTYLHRLIKKAAQYQRP